MARTTRRRIRPGQALGVAILLLGCGYGLVGRGTNLPPDVRRVYLEPLENRTQRSQVEQFLSQAIADELLTRKRFTLVTTRPEADAVLHGAVLAFVVTPVTFNDQGLAEEYEISITAEMAFQRLDNDQTLWSNDHYLFKQTYEVESSEEDFFDRENVAIGFASVRFAETMVSDLLQGF